MYQLCQKLAGLEPYEPNEGTYSIRLDANESFITPDSARLSEISRIAAGVALNRYPDPKASELCRAFADYYGVMPECVAAGNGSDELISVIANSFLERGETAVVTAPDFSMYGFYFSLAEINVVTAQKNPELKIDVDELITLARENAARMIMFSNPCNPTGQILTRDEVIKLVTSTDALVVLDEAYMDFADESLITRINDFDNLLILRTCSKAFGMACLRLGFAVGNKKLVNAIKACKSPYNVNSVSQAIGTYLLSDKKYLADCTERIIASKNELQKAIASLLTSNKSFSVFESHTNFVLIKTARAAEIFEALKKSGIVIRKLGSDLLRISAGNAEENAAVITELKKII